MPTFRLVDLSAFRLVGKLGSWRDGPKGHGGVRRVRWRARAELVQTVRVGGRRPGGGTFGRATAGGGVLLLGAAERVGGSRYGVVALDASAAGGKERERVFGLPRGKTSGRAGGMNWNDTEAGCVRRSPLRGWVAVVQVAVYPGAG